MPHGIYSYLRPLGKKYYKQWVMIFSRRCLMAQSTQWLDTVENSRLVIGLVLLLSSNSMLKYQLITE